MDFKIGQKLILLQQRQLIDLAAEVLGLCAEDGIAGRGHQGDVAGIDEAGGEDRQRGFGADGVDDLRLSGSIPSTPQTFFIHRAAACLKACRRCRRSCDFRVLAAAVARAWMQSGNAISSGSPTPMSISSAPGLAARAERLARLIFSNL